MKKQIDLVGLFVSAAELMFMNEGRFHECEEVSGDVVRWMLIVGLQDQDNGAHAVITLHIFYILKWKKCSKSLFLTLLHSLYHWQQGEKELPSTQSLRQASQWVLSQIVMSSLPSFSFGALPALWSSCGPVTFDFSNLHLFFVCQRQLYEKHWDCAGRSRFWGQSQLSRTKRLEQIYCIWWFLWVRVFHWCFILPGGPGDPQMSVIYLMDRLFFCSLLCLPSQICSYLQWGA